MMDIYTRLLMMDIMISAVAIMVNILENETVSSFV